LKAMCEILRHVPTPPLWKVDWEGAVRQYEILGTLAGCHQDEEWHGEGDVAVHSRMVCEALAGLEAWRLRDERERSIIFTAALLHDIGKPSKTRMEGGRIRSRGHSRKGEMLARVLLWEMGVPIMIREQIAGLIRSHQVPFFLIDRPDRERLLFELSQSVRLDYLGLVAEADARGRVCADGTRLLENIALFLQYAREEGCLDRPREFPSALSRFEYFARDDRSANYLAYDNTRVDTVVMSGLPGAGKDTWIAENLPRWKVISLDRLREEMKIAADCPQGRVVQRAREIAREFLRRGESFVWSATNTSREMRSNVVRLLRSYNARVRIVYVEAPAGELYRRNRERKRVVPEEVITRLLNRWEPPSITEGHEVDWVA